MWSQDYRFRTQRNSFTKTQPCPDTMNSRFRGGIDNDWAPTLTWSQHQRLPIKLWSIQQGNP